MHKTSKGGENASDSAPSKYKFQWMYVLKLKMQWLMMLKNKIKIKYTQSIKSWQTYINNK